MAGHMSLLQDCYGLLGGLKPGMAGSGNCESLFTLLKTNKMIAERYLARHFSSALRPLGEGELDNANWAPATENPADGPTQVRSDVVTLPRLLGSGHLNPGSSRPLKGVAWRDKGGRGAYGD